MSFQNLQDVLAARLVILVELGALEPAEASAAVIAIRTMFEKHDTGELMIALENAMWTDKAIHEENDLDCKPAREGVDNDGLTDAEVTAALDEHTRTANYPPA